MWRVNGQLHGTAVFLLVKQPPLQAEKRLGGPWSQSGHFGEHNLMPLLQFSNPESSHYTDRATVAPHKRIMFRKLRDKLKLM
jgi:hypothetical protein